MHYSKIKIQGVQDSPDQNIIAHPAPGQHSQVYLSVGYIIFCSASFGRVCLIIKEEMIACYQYVFLCNTGWINIFSSLVGWLWSSLYVIYPFLEWIFMKCPLCMEHNARTNGRVSVPMDLTGQWSVRCYGYKHTIGYKSKSCCEPTEGG